LAPLAGEQLNDQSHSALGAFDKHDLFYDDEKPERYNDTKPKEANMYQRFVHDDLVMQILARIFLSSA
jgi:hypothetical protein